MERAFQVENAPSTAKIVLFKGTHAANTPTYKVRISAQIIRK
jgi:hypothetical protein